MGDFRSMTEVLIDRAERAPDRDALVLVPDRSRGGRAESVSYAGLDAAARSLAGWLQEHGARGERVMVLHSSPHRFAVSFLACLYAGAVAVPAPPPGGRGHHGGRVVGILHDAAPCAVLTDAAAAPDVSRLLADCGRGALPCLASDAHHGQGEWRMPDLRPDGAAYLQYTSGSTGRPRGVVVTHGNLMAAQQAIGDLLGTSDRDRVGGWLPFHHDMGLVGQLLHPLWAGGTCVTLSAHEFVRHPVRWLEAVSRYGITISGAPNFGYDLCTRLVTDEQLAGLDLSGWRAAVNGGEPVRADTTRAFTRRFAAAGFRPGALLPCYGLAEATLMVTGTRPTHASPAAAELVVDAEDLERHVLTEATGSAGDRPTRTLQACGSRSGTDVRIVAPESRKVLADGEIGEIWVRGPSVAHGYRHSLRTDEPVFGVATADGEPGFLRTGDLGALHGGLLYVTGRIKDVIMVAGRNIYPQDLEHAMQRVSTLFGTGSAFGVGRHEHVVVVQELRTTNRYPLDLAGLAKDVKRRLSEEFEVTVDGVLLVRPGTVRRTTSGKVRRSEMRRLFLNGGLRPLYQQLADDPTGTGALL